MKETNEKVLIELTNVVTDETFAWRLREHAVPTQVLLSMKDEELQAERKKYIEDHKLPKKADDSTALDWASLSVEHQEKLTAIALKSQHNMLDELKSMIVLVGELPDGYMNERELLSHCIGDYSVVPLIRSLFTQRSGNTITSPGRGTSLIRFKRPSGEYYDPFPAKNEQAKVQD
jgi:hypothetical protein